MDNFHAKNFVLEYRSVFNIPSISHIINLFRLLFALSSDVRIFIKKPI